MQSNYTRIEQHKVGVTSDFVVFGKGNFFRSFKISIIQICIEGIYL